MKTNRFALLPVFMLLVLASPVAQDAPAPEVLRTPAGAFEALGVNSAGYREFKRLRDGATMVLVPDGAFEKWTYHSDPGADPTPARLHVHAFLIDKHEVTNAQAAAFLRASTGLSYRDGAVFNGDTRLARAMPRGLEVTAEGARARPGLENLPFVGGTGHFAVAFAAWAGAALPWAYEWEKAAAGPSGLAFPWGSDYPDSTLANLFLHGPKQTMPVGSYPRGHSHFGVLDMAGNVAERVYIFEREQDVTPDSLPVMIKGGSWATTHWANVRVVDQDFQRMDDAEGTIGFRTVIRDAGVIRALGITQRPTLRILDDLDDALAEAAARNVPLFLFLSFDTCGPSDRTRAQVFTDERFIAWMNENAVVLAGHHPGDSGDLPVDRNEGPSVMYPGCRAEKLRAVYSELCEVIDIKRIPEAIWDFKQSPGQFALNPHEDLFEEATDMLLVGEAEFPKGGEDVQTYLTLMQRAQKALGEGQTRTDFLAGKPGPKTTWKREQGGE